MVRICVEFGRLRCRGGSTSRINRGSFACLRDRHSQDKDCLEGSDSRLSVKHGCCRAGIKHSWIDLLGQRGRPTGVKQLRQFFDDGSVSRSVGQIELLRIARGIIVQLILRFGELCAGPFDNPVAVGA